MKENLQIDSDDLEEMIITTSIKYKSFFLKFKKFLFTKSKNKSYFKDIKNQMIFNMLSLWFDKYQKMPSQKELLYLVHKIQEEEEVKNLLAAMIIRSFNDTSSINLEFLENETKEFVIESRVYESMLISQQFFQDGKYSAIADSMREAININLDKDLGVSILDFDRIQKEFETIGEAQGVPIGLPTLDHLLGGGVKQKEMFVLASTAGLFKTGFMGCAAVHNFLLGKKVVMYTFETSTARLLSRFIQNLANVSKRELLSDNSYLDKLKNVYDVNTVGDIILKSYEANSVCCNDLAAHIEELKEYKGWTPDLIIVDYLLLLKANNPFSDSNNSYKYYKTVSEEIRNLGVRYNAPTITAIQINREGMGETGGSKVITTSKNIAESAGVFHTADYFATLNQTSKDKEKDRLMIFLEKNRNDEGHRKIYAQIDYEHMRINEMKE